MSSFSETSPVKKTNLLFSLLLLLLLSCGPGSNQEGDLQEIELKENAGFRCQLRVYTKLGQGIAIMTYGDNGGQLIAEILRAFSEVTNRNGISQSC